MTSAWLETSIAQASTPRSRITANSACRSGASGVVRAVLTSSPAIRVPSVPTTPATLPVAARAPSASRVVVVLPWVPVIPIIRIAAAGSPYTWAARRPSTRRGSGTTRTGVPPGAAARPSSSVSSATAPAASASAA